MKESVLKGLDLDRAKAALQSKPEDVGKPSLIALYLPLEAIQPDPNQPRRSVEGEGADDQSLEDLAASILQHGVLQPITVEALEKGKYQIIAGERRWRAAKLALESGQPCARKNYDLRRIPAVILQSESPSDRLEMQLVENLARSDMRDEDVAKALETLLETLQVSKAELARRLGRSPDWIRMVVTKGSPEAQAVAERIGLAISDIGATETQRLIVWANDADRAYLLDVVAEALQVGQTFSRHLLDEIEKRHVLETRYPALRGRNLSLEDLQFVSDHLEDQDPLQQARAQRILDGEPEPLEQPVVESGEKPRTKREPQNPKATEGVGAGSGAEELDTNDAHIDTAEGDEIEQQDFLTPVEGGEEPGPQPFSSGGEGDGPETVEAVETVQVGDGMGGEIPDVAHPNTTSTAPVFMGSTLSVPIPIALVERIFEYVGMSCDLSAVDAQSVVTALEKLISG